MTYKCIEFPGVDFPTQNEMFMTLKAYEADIITLKKSKSFEGRQKNSISYLNVDVNKLFSGAKTLPFEIKEDSIYPVISTTRWRDSHKDVHFDSCFNRTYKSQAGKVAYALDHELKYNSIIAWPKNVEMIVSPIPWGMVGKDFQGETEGLIFGIEKKNVRLKEVLSDIEQKSHDFENSIRMVYKKITLGINSTEKDLSVNKAYFDSRINLIANKNEVMEDGYFWGVEELAIDREGSLVVAGGSNDATSIITLELAKSTSDNEADPSKDTRTKSVWDQFII